MAQKPKINFPTNIPITIRVGKKFWEGEGQYGMSYGWNMIEGGIEKSCFVKPYLNDKIKAYPKGTELTITKREVVGEGGRPRTEWLVVPVGMEPPPSYQAQTPAPAPNGRPEPSYMPDAGNRESYRSERVERAKEAVADAMEALQVDALDENVRALAISFLIDEQHKGIAPPEDGGPF